MDPASRYEIVDRIAAGDFATIYRARDRELEREVAVKQIHPQYLHDPEQLARYWQEAQLLASLQHPNVLTVYDVVRGALSELPVGSGSETCIAPGPTEVSAVDGETPAAQSAPGAATTDPPDPKTHTID